MAIDPSIPLGIRPLNIPAPQFQTPLERYAKIQSLRNLMAQGQLGQLNLEQTQLENERLRREAQEQQGLASWMQQNQRPDLTPQEIVSAHPNPTGIKFATAWSAQKTGALTQYKASLDAAHEKAKAEDRIYNSVIPGDKQSKLTALAELVQLKVITGDQAAQIAGLPDAEFAKIQQHAAAGSLDRLQRIKAEQDSIALRIAQVTEGDVMREAKAKATSAEQTAAGTTPISLQQAAQAKAQLWTTPGGLTSIIKDPNSSAVDVARAQEQLDLLAGYHSVANPPLGPISPERLAQDIDKAVRISKLTGEGPKAVRAEIRAQDLGKQWQQSSKLLERYRVAASGYDSVKQMLAGGGPQDLAVIYGFAKAMDPESVVRESEVENAMKTGNIFSGALARFNGLWKPGGGFLSPQVKQDFLKAIKTRMESTRKQVFAEHGEIKRQQEVISPGSSEALYNPGVLDPEDFKAKDLKGTSTDELLRKLLEKRK